MKVSVSHSIEQDMSVVKFNSLKDYSRALKFLDANSLSWTPLKYSSKNDSASIRVTEKVLQSLSNKFGIGKSCQY